MIRKLFIFFLMLISLKPFAQTLQTKIFKTTEYVNGNFYRQLFDTIKIKGGHTDIYFFKDHFQYPYYLPTKFTDEQFKNQKISIWSDTTGKKDYLFNWENTCSYDSIGRITAFSYSACLVCSSLPYNYTVTYNAKGQVEQMNNLLNMKDSYRFYYNDSGDLVRLEKFLAHKKEMSIQLTD